MEVIDLRPLATCVDEFRAALTRVLDGQLAKAESAALSFLIHATAADDAGETTRANALWALFDAATELCGEIRGRR